MKKIFLSIGLLLFVLAVFYSCTPEYGATVEELDLAISSYDKDQNFSQLSTFYLADTIIYISDDKVTIQREDNPTEELILSQVRQNLLNYGWVEIKDTTNTSLKPDVAILVSVLQADIYYYYTYWWDWWYWYPWDWWYPGYPGYPWYPDYPSYPSYGYTVGTILIDMMNLKDLVLPPVEDHTSIKPPIVWSGIVNGILSGSKDNIEGRITNQVEQVFLQSEYLHKATIN